MKNLLILSMFITSMASFASSDFIGDYNLQTGSRSCESFISIIKTKKETDRGEVSGLRFLPTRNIESMFEEDGAEDFLNLNGPKVIITTKNSSHGTKYVSSTESTRILKTITKEGTLKEYNFGFRTSKTNLQVTLNLTNDILSYEKVLSGSNNWNRKCQYIKL